jgi:ABC-type uncharacterized transport system permease subunit
MVSLLVLTLALYATSSVLLWRQLRQPQVAPALLWILPAAALAGHAWLLWNHLELDQFDHFNITTSLSTVAFMVALLSLLRSGRSGGLLLRPVIYIFAAASVILMYYSPTNWGAQVSHEQGLILHIVLSLVAYAILVMATLYAIQLLYLNYLLKHHRASIVSHQLPPLMTVERYFFRLLTTGTLVLFIALAAGFVFLNDMLAQGQAHKTILSLVAASLYLIVVVCHGIFQIRGRLLVLTSVIASVVLTLAYFGSRFVKDVLLSA